MRAQRCDGQDGVAISQYRRVRGAIFAPASWATPHPGALPPQQPVTDAAACPRQPSSTAPRLRCSALSAPLLSDHRRSSRRPGDAAELAHRAWLKAAITAQPALRLIARHAARPPDSRSESASAAFSLAQRGILRISPSPMRQLSEILPSLGPRRVQMRRRQLHQLRPAIDAATRP